MSEAPVAQRYAKSIMDLAIEREKLESIVEDMKTLQAVSKNREFVLMLESPIVNSDKKLAVLNKLFATNCDALTVSFMKICVQKGRENVLPEMANAFLAAYQKMRGVLAVKVTSAQTLTPEVLEILRTKVLAAVKGAKAVEFETKVNPALIGGFLIEMGDTLFDASIAHSLEQLKKSFAA